MKCVLQRVKQARVEVDAKVVAEIAFGLVVLLAVEANDTQINADSLLEKIINVRVFADAQQKMHASLQQVKGDLLTLSQFTLLATFKGKRPSFSAAADAELAKYLYDYFCQQASQCVNLNKTATGVFAAHMQLYLINDGPVTLILES